MKRNLFFTLLAASLFAALFTCAAYAEGWQDRASESSPVYPPTAVCEPGDMDGDGALAPADARTVLRLSVGLERPDGYYSSGDVDGDGAVAPEDARLVLRYSVGLDGYTPPRADDGAYVVRLWSDRADIIDNMEGLLPLTVNETTAEDVRNGAIPLWRLCSTEDADRFAEEMSDPEKIDTTFPSPDLKTVLGRYDEAFFETRELLLALYISNNGRTIPAVYPPATDNGTLTISVGSAYTVGESPIVVNRLLLLPVSKENAEGYAAYNALRGEGLALTEQEYQAAGEGRTKWEFANAHLLERDDSAGLRTVGVYYAALKNTRNSDFRWVCEADCEIREYQPWKLITERDATENYLYVREETVMAPGGASDEFLQYFIIAAPFSGDYTLRFRQIRNTTPPGTEPDMAEENGVRYTVSLSVKKTEPTTEPAVMDTVRPATENGAVATSSLAPFNLYNIVFGKSTLMGFYTNCIFRGVIEAIDRSSVSWTTDDGKQSGPYERALLTVRITRSHYNMPDTASIRLLYVYDLADDADTPAAVRIGQEYLFVDCRLTDEDYYEKAAVVLPDFVENDETLHMADAVAGPAKYTFMPIKDSTCTVYKEYFSEEQLKMKEKPPEFPDHEPIPGTDYVTVKTDDMVDYLLKLTGLQGVWFG